MVTVRGSVVTIRWQMEITASSVFLFKRPSNSYSEAYIYALSSNICLLFTFFYLLLIKKIVGAVVQATYNGTTIVDMKKQVSRQMALSLLLLSIIAVTCVLSNRRIDQLLTTVGRFISSDDAHCLRNEATTIPAIDSSAATAVAAAAADSKWRQLLLKRRTLRLVFTLRYVTLRYATPVRMRVREFSWPDALLLFRYPARFRGTRQIRPFNATRFISIICATFLQSNRFRLQFSSVSVIVAVWRYSLCHLNAVYVIL